MVAEKVSTRRQEEEMSHVECHVVCLVVKLPKGIFIQPYLLLLLLLD